jgi:hypothetical protein
MGDFFGSFKPRQFWVGDPWAKADRQPVSPPVRPSGPGGLDVGFMMMMMMMMVMVMMTMMSLLRADGHFPEQGNAIVGLGPF